MPINSYIKSRLVPFLMRVIMNLFVLQKEKKNLPTKSNGYSVAFDFSVYQRDYKKKKEKEKGKGKDELVSKFFLWLHDMISPYNLTLYSAISNQMRRCDNNHYLSWGFINQKFSSSFFFFFVVVEMGGGRTKRKRRALCKSPFQSQCFRLGRSVQNFIVNGYFFFALLASLISTTTTTRFEVGEGTPRSK